MSNSQMPYFPDTAIIRGKPPANPVLKPGKVLCATADFVVYYYKGALIVTNPLNGQVIFKKQLINGMKKNPLLARLLRNEPKCAILLEDNCCLISHLGKIWCYNPHNNSLTVEHVYARKMRNPLNFCVVTLPGEQQTIYYGEYISNPAKGPVAIYKRNAGKWTKIYEFAQQTITHIHNIIYDSYRNIFYILTGDLDQESGIWVADHSFQQISPLCIGKQLYRTCVAMPTAEGLLYATDTPLEGNWLMKLSLDGLTVRKIERICKLPGPCIYGTSFGEDYLFSTSVEPDSSLPRWQYYVTRKLGNGVCDKYSHVFLLKKTGELKEIVTGKKDNYFMGLFQFGTFQFPCNTTKDIILTTQALREGHGNTLYIKLEGKDARLTY